MTNTNGAASGGSSSVPTTAGRTNYGKWEKIATDLVADHEREEEAEAMRIWNELREKEKSNAREMERRSKSQPRNKGVRFDRSVRNRTSSFETLETYGTAGTAGTAGTESSNAFDINFWIPSCGTDFADSFADSFGGDGGCLSAMGGMGGATGSGCVDGWLDNSGWLDNLFGGSGGDNTNAGTDQNGSPSKAMTGGASKNKGSPGSPTTVTATKIMEV